MLVLLLLLALPAVVQAQSYTDSYGTWYYTTANGTITITKYLGSGGDVTIPSEISNLPVTTIGDHLDPLGPTGAFADCTNLTSVTIPNSVTTIGYAAFCICTSLTSVTIPNSVTNIGDSAFVWCTGLVTVTIPNSVTSIGSAVFEECSSLISATIPNSLTNLGDFDFENCGSLTSVYFQGNAPSVGVFEFRGSSQVTVYYLPGTTGWGTTYGGCPTAVWNTGPSCALQVTISPPSVVSAGAQWQVDGGAWQDSGTIVSNLPVGGHTVTFSTVTGWTTAPSQGVTVSANGMTTTVGTYNVAVFDGLHCTVNDGALTITAYTGPGGAVTIPPTISGLPVTSIGVGAFANCTNLTSVTFGTNVTSIEDSAFRYCSNLASVTIPNSITNIGPYGFEGCGLTRVTIGDGLTGIGDYAFTECTSLSAITVDANNPSYSSVGGSCLTRCRPRLCNTQGARPEATRSPTGSPASDSMRSLIPSA